MRVVVTGAAGFIGGSVCRELRHNHEVLGIDSFQGVLYSPEDKRRNAAELNQIGIDIHELDLRSSDLGPVLKNAEAVVHLAALPGLVPSWTHYEEYLSCNVLGTIRLVEAATAESVVRFVHGSTSSVYGANAIGDETQVCAPVSPYGVTKMAAEEVVLAHHRVLGLPAVILRFFSVYGPGQRPDMAYHRFIEAALNGTEIDVYGDGHQTRSNTFVSDCTSAILSALERGVNGEIYNIGGGSETSLLEVIDLINNQCNRELKINYLPSRVGDQRHTRADCSKAQGGLGYAPSVSPAEGIALQVEWHHRRQNNR